MILLAAYDVSNNNRRAHLAATLQTAGDRIQKSVFALTLPADEAAVMRQHAAQAIDLRTDSLIFFRQCETCYSGREEHGQFRTPEPRLYWAV